MTQAFQIGPGQVGEKFILPIWAGGRESHNSNTPLSAGAFALNPDDYGLAGTTLTFQFVCVVANGNTPLTTHVHIYNLTDSEIVTSSAINIVNSTEPAQYAPALVVGTGAGELKTGFEKIYECRIFLDAVPGDPALDTIELFKAEVRATHLIL